MKHLKLEILNQLSRCRAYLLPEPTLRDACLLALPGTVDSDVTLALRALETDGLIIAAKQPVTDTTLWKLTAAGTAALAELKR